MKGQDIYPPGRAGLEHGRQKTPVVHGLGALGVGGRQTCSRHPGLGILGAHGLAALGQQRHVPFRIRWMAAPFDGQIGLVPQDVAVHPAPVAGRHRGHEGRVGLDIYGRIPRPLGCLHGPVGRLIQADHRAQAVVLGPGQERVAPLPHELAPGGLQLPPGEDLDHHVHAQGRGLDQFRGIPVDGVDTPQGPQPSLPIPHGRSHQQGHRQQQDHHPSAVSPRPGPHFVCRIRHTPSSPPT